MGSKHGAEICELVGLYLLKVMENIVDQENIGIYRGRVNSTFQKNKWNCSWEIEEKIHENAKTIGLKIEIERPSYIINFLDMNLNTINNIFQPYLKPNNIIDYIN